MKALVLLISTLLLSLPAWAQQQPKAPGPGEATPQAKQSLSNAGLTGKVKTALATDVGLKTLTGIDVDSEGGMVTLKGHVDSEDARQRAEAVAKKVEGVKSVTNRLTVRKPSS